MFITMASPDLEIRLLKAPLYKVQRAASVTNPGG